MDTRMKLYIGIAIVVIIIIIIVIVYTVGSSSPYEPGMKLEIFRIDSTKALNSTTLKKTEYRTGPVSFMLKDNTMFGATEMVGLRASGYLLIPEGKHKFDMIRDDGANLTIGNQSLKLWGDSSPTLTTDIEVTSDGKTYVPFTMEYYNAGGYGIMQLNMDRRVVPGEIVFRDKVSTTST